MKMAIVCLAVAGAFAWPAATFGAPATQPQAQTQAGSAQQLTFEQKVQLFLFGNLNTGQPNVECGEEDALNRPGHAENARGSAFNPDGIAGQHYAGEQPQNSKNPKSVSQYDTACAHAQSPM
jgi:hypothetical protein